VPLALHLLAQKLDETAVAGTSGKSILDWRRPGRLILANNRNGDLDSRTSGFLVDPTNNSKSKGILLSHSSF